MKGANSLSATLFRRSYFGNHDLSKEMDDLTSMTDPPTCDTGEYLADPDKSVLRNLVEYAHIRRVIRRISCGYK